MKLKSNIAYAFISFILIVFSCTISLANCDYNENKYSERAVTCQSSHQYACEDGSWIDIGAECPNAQTMQAYDNSICICTNEDVLGCNAFGQQCDASQESGKCIRKCID